MVDLLQLYDLQLITLSRERRERHPVLTDDSITHQFTTDDSNDSITKLAHPIPLLSSAYSLIPSCAQIVYRKSKSATVKA